MVHLDALLRAFTEYADALLGAYEVGEVLYRLTDQVVEVLPVDAAGLSLGRQAEELRFVTATGRGASRVEAAQVETGDGPCFDTYRSGDTVVCESLDDEPRWPVYRRVALEEGFRALAAVPLPVGEHRIGALVLYRRASGAWDERTLEVARVLANMASGYVLNWRTLEESRTLAEQLQHALDSRVVIEQAKGIVAARNHIDVNAAFERLRQQSRSTNTRLHDVCRRVVAGELQL